MFTDRRGLQGVAGEELAEMARCPRRCSSFLRHGKPVHNSYLMRRALEYAQLFDVPWWTTARTPTSRPRASCTRRRRDPPRAPRCPGGAEEVMAPGMSFSRS